jgi:hypothetical protein
MAVCAAIIPSTPSDSMVSAAVSQAPDRAARVSHAVGGITSTSFVTRRGACIAACNAVPQPIDAPAAM